MRNEDISQHTLSDEEKARLAKAEYNRAYRQGKRIKDGSKRMKPAKVRKRTAKRVRKWKGEHPKEYEEQQIKYWSQMYDKRKEMVSDAGKEKT